ncbi:hypothetical protein ACOSP7_002806 [Xanthoceras sorbifolium]
MFCYLRVRGTAATQGRVEEVARHTVMHFFFASEQLARPQVAFGGCGTCWTLFHFSARADSLEPWSHSHLTLHTGAIFSSVHEQIVRPQVAVGCRGTCWINFLFFTRKQLAASTGRALL